MKLDCAVPNQSQPWELMIQSPQFQSQLAAINSLNSISLTGLLSPPPTQLQNKDLDFPQAPCWVFVWFCLCQTDQRRRGDIRLFKCL